MVRLTFTDPESHSSDQVAENIERLRAVFPELVIEGPVGSVVNVDILKTLVGDKTVSDSDERYGLNWHGKRRARQLAVSPSFGTLRPCQADSFDWDNTQNLMIEGDNLEVLKLLQKSYAKKVKAIYIDPPYNTGRNLVYPNDYTDGIRTYLEVTGQIEGGQVLISNAETNGRFHTNWLNAIFPRLLAAKSLLRPDGVLFCAIDENEHAALSLVLKDVFPEGTYEHAYVTIVHNPRGQQGKNISYVHENGVFVYRADQNKYLADVKRDEIDSRNLRDSGTESDRNDARTCFYPFFVKDGTIVSIGEVPPDSFHPGNPNILRPDGSTEIWPITDAGKEKKWRYNRASVSSILASLEAKMGRENLQIIFHKKTGTMRSVWRSARYDSSEYGTKLVESLIGPSGFTFPKSLWAVSDALSIMTANTEDALILDFYAGSGTTGHAVWEVTKEVGGSRRFILVQLPEPLNPDDPDQQLAAEFCDKLGVPRNIAELTKERLRQASMKIKEANPQLECDFGFRVFKLDSSNIRAWDPDKGNLEKSLLDHMHPIKLERSEVDVLYEILLKAGLDLSIAIESRSIQGKEVHCVGGGTLMLCLSEKIEREVASPLADGIAEWHKSLAPQRDTTLVFRDDAFVDDVCKTNLTASLQEHGLLNVRSI